MSTEFVSTSNTALDDFSTEFVAWGRRDGVAFEFGTVSNFERVRRLLAVGETFVGLGSSTAPATVEELDQLLVAGRVTFGEFPFTVAVGTGELFRFTVEEDAA